jgi:hypothetical protein
MVINVAMETGVFHSANIPLSFVDYGGASMATGMLNACSFNYVGVRRSLFNDDPVILNQSVWEDRGVTLILEKTLRIRRLAAFNPA